MLRPVSRGKDTNYYHIMCREGYNFGVYKVWKMSRKKINVTNNYPVDEGQTSPGQIALNMSLTQWSRQDRDRKSQGFKATEMAILTLNMITTCLFLMSPGKRKLPVSGHLVCKNHNPSTGWSYNTTCNTKTKTNLVSGLFSYWITKGGKQTKDFNSVTSNSSSTCHKNRRECSIE